MMLLNGKAHRTSDIHLFISFLQFFNLFGTTAPRPPYQGLLIPDVLDHTRRNTVARTILDE